MPNMNYLTVRFSHHNAASVEMTAKTGPVCAHEDITRALLTCLPVKRRGGLRSRPVVEQRSWKPLPPPQDRELFSELRIAT